MKKKIKNYALFLIIFSVGIYIGSSFYTPKKVHSEAEEIIAQKWTCSMHPQISQPHQGDCPICGMDLIPAEQVSEAVGINDFEMSDNAMALANIQTFEIGRDFVEGYTTELIGEVTANADKLAVQAAHFKGRLESWYVKYKGQSIKKGQLIGKMYAPDILVAQKELLTALSLKESDPQIYEAVREKLKLWKFTDAMIEKIARDKKLINYIPIYADFSGVVTILKVDEGDHVKEGTELFEIAPLNTLWAEFDAYQPQANLFKVGNLLEIKGDNFSQKAPIIFIEPFIDAIKRTFKVRVLIKNTQNKLKIGAFLQAQVKISLQEKQITIPKSSVLWTGKRSVVYIKKPKKNTFQMREIILDDTPFEDFYVVKQGLSEGEAIVSYGVFTVDATAQLLGKESMMTASLSDKKHSLKLSGGTEEKFLSLLASYLKIKNFLVLSDSTNIVKQNKKFLGILNSFSRYQQRETKYWASLLENSKKLSSIKNIAQQRILFSDISKIMESLSEQFAVPYPLFLQYCPMANSNQGAYWLSKEKNIKNPYYGKAMLTCGEVKKSWAISE